MHQTPRFCTTYKYSPGWIGTRSANNFAASLSAIARENLSFALSETCKGLIILGLGDFATADVFAEFIQAAHAAAPTMSPLAVSLMRLHWAQA